MTASNAAAADYCPNFTAEALKRCQRKWVELPTTLRSHQLRSPDTLCGHRAGCCHAWLRYTVSFLLGNLRSSMPCYRRPDAAMRLWLMSSRA